MAFDLFAKENDLLQAAQDVFASGSHEDVLAYAQRLVSQLAESMQDNQHLTRHSDRQQKKLVDFNHNLKTQAVELEKQRKSFEDLSQKLGKYLSPQVHDAIFSGRQDVQITTRRKKMTVFFSDIRSFTSTSESLQPEALTIYLNEYFSLLTRVALKYGATIDKYIGDAMMVFFGDPDSKGEQEDAWSCVAMAMEMQEELTQLKAAWRRRGFVDPFQTRMGINTGYCNVGNFGSDQRLTYTIIGAEVNVAARIEAEADPDGILISHETYAHVADHVRVEPRPPVILKGISRPIQTYAILGRSENLTSPVQIQISTAAGAAVDSQAVDVTDDMRQQIVKELRTLLQRFEHSAVQP